MQQLPRHNPQRPVLINWMGSVRHVIRLRLPKSGRLRRRTTICCDPSQVGRIATQANEMEFLLASWMHRESFDSSECVWRERPGSCKANPEVIAVSFE